MKIFSLKFTTFLGIATIALASPAWAKPLKVFILCGQSNMEGHAELSTFPAIAKDPKTADIYKEMVGADGKPVVCKDVWVAYSFGDFNGNPSGKKSGQLTAGFGSQHHVRDAKIGPEFTFGIYMHKALNEPILLIKGAWGGKSLRVDFRPPSGGPVEDEKSREAAGKYYAFLMEHVKAVLADPKKVYPDYNPAEGYELTGFVWFQGFNDLVGPYPTGDGSNNKKSPKDYSEYSRLLSCLIRDVRKDLSAPKLPFVIGVLGVGGDNAGPNTDGFRKAMAAPGESAEFKGTVANVFTQKFWPTELDAVLAKIKPIKDEYAAKEKAAKGQPADPKARKQAAEEMREKIKQALTPDELFLLDNGISNQGFHYHGSAKFFAQAGKAFAEALVDLKKSK